MCARFERGESFVLRVFTSDLSQRELGSRINQVLDKNTGKIKRIQNNFANHAVTVAGFTKSDEGKCTGIYLNDTGHFTSSNRIWKFISMQKNTQDFGAEFCKRIINRK